MIDNVKILFQYILDYDKYVHRDTNLYSVITCNDRFDPIYEKQVELILSNKLFDIYEVLDLINEYKGELLYDTSFKDIVKSKLKNCSKKPYGLFDLFTGDVSFKSNNRCDVPKNELLRLNEQNLIFYRKIMICHIEIK